MDSVVFDIETGPQPLEHLKQILPAFDPATLGKHPGEFDESTVKHGRTKDPEIIQAKVEECRIKHEAAVKEFEAKLAGGESNHWKAVLERAALDAITGQVVAIGYSGKKAQVDGITEARTEAMIISTFWKSYTNLAGSGRRMVGFNIAEFDIPFLVQRSFILGIAVPKSVFSQGKYLDSTFVDLRKIWLAGRYNGTGTLDAICRACGVGKKPEGVDGGMFAKLYADPLTRPEAIEYLLNDLDMTVQVALRMGVD